MKLWVTLVAATLLAGCGAQPPLPPAPPTSPAPPSPAPPLSRFWGVLAGGAENGTRGGALIRRLRLWVTALQSEVAEVGQRALDYGAEARSVLELGWQDLRSRAASYGRKLRKRLHRDGEELRRRWEALGRAWGEPRDMGETHEAEEQQ